MKIKVDKEEYESLLRRVAMLERVVNEEEHGLFENWRWTEERLFQMMEDYFKYDCMTVITKRDKDMIVGEVRKAAMDNLFKEEDNKIIDKNINTM